MPGVISMAEAVGAEPVYRLASQYVHATDFAGWQFRRNLGNDAEYGEYIDEHDWGRILKLSWQPRERD